MGNSRSILLSLSLSLGIASMTSGCPTEHPVPASCTSSRECSASGLVCDTASMTCVECLANTDCLGGSSVCTAHRCRPITHCTSSRECPGLVCDPALGYCVECLSDVDCMGGQHCVSSACVSRSIDAGVPDTLQQDTGPFDVGPVDVDAGPPPPFVGEVDLLLMIDNSNSMTEEQQSIVTEIPRLVRVLSTGDRDGDGIADFTPATSLHIGIVDSDMGLGDVTGITSCDPGFGDDGLMQIRARHPAPGCMMDYSTRYPTTPNVFAFAAGGAATTAQFSSDVACVAALGTDGCGFEFELESPLKAISLTPTSTGDSPVAWTHAGYRPPVFFGGTFGHGNDGTTNGAFLRPGSVLAIVTVNDEDDCSSPNYHIFGLDDPAYSGVDLNLRCHAFPDELYPVSRYAEGFLGLRRDPTRLVYAAITGVPPAVAGMDPAVILADPLMTEQVNPAMPNQLVPACVSPGGRGVAYPAVRMTRLAQMLNTGGARTTVQSICNSNFGPAFDAVIVALQFALTAAH